MLRATLRLIATGGVVAVTGMADSIELYAASAGAVLALPFVVGLIGPRRRAVSEPLPATEVRPLPPLPMASVPMMPATGPAHVAPELPEPSDLDFEGNTVRAPMSSEEAYEMHARYAPSFDQQVAIARYDAHHAAEVIEQDRESPPEVFDQDRYAAALQYAQAFESQLAKARRTAAYEVAPRRMARGSITSQQYRGLDKRSDQLTSLAISPSDWDERTLLGLAPRRK